MSRGSEHIRVGKWRDDWNRELEEIRLDRIRRGVDNKSRSAPEIMGKVLKTDSWSKLKEELKLKKFIEELRPPRLFKDRRGGIFDMLAMTIGIVLIIVIGLAFIIIAGIILYSSNTVTTNLLNIDGGSNVTNFTNWGDRTLGQFNLGLQSLRWISYAIIFGMIAGVLGAGLYTYSHPFFFPLYLLLSIGLVMFSIYIQRAYENLYLNGNVLGTTLQSFVGASWVMIHLPVVIGAVSLIGGVMIAVSWSQEGGI